MTKAVHYDDKTLQAQIWDTAGAQRYRSMARLYYRGALGALIVFDITRELSFQNLIIWIEEVRKAAGEEVVLMIIGNKCDLSNQRTVFAEQAIALAESEGIPYLETSALDEINVEEAFYQLMKRIYESMKLSLDQSMSTPRIDLNPSFSSQVFQRQKKRCCC